MAWSIAEVASMSKVTARTLRHYDDIGLLRPAYVADNGYRYYEQQQLLRLQRLLLLRELGLSLATIADVLDGQRDEITALQEHARWLNDERERLSRLALTLSRTIHHLEGGPQMSAPELFEGFAERKTQLEDDLAHQHGDGVREHFPDRRGHHQGLDTAGLPRRPAPRRRDRRQDPHRDANGGSP